jgi:hypothetical protein
MSLQEEGGATVLVKNHKTSPANWFPRSATQAARRTVNKGFSQKVLTRGMREKELRAQRYDVKGTSRGNPGGKSRVEEDLRWEILLKRFGGNFLILWSVQKMLSRSHTTNLSSDVIFHIFQISGTRRY